MPRTTTRTTITDGEPLERRENIETIQRVASIEAKIDSFTDLMRGFQETLMKVSDQVSSLVNDYARDMTSVNERLRQVFDTLADHKKMIDCQDGEIDDLKKVTIEMAQTNNILKWMLGLATAVIVLVSSGFVVALVRVVIVSGWWK